MTANGSAHPAGGSAPSPSSRGGSPSCTVWTGRDESIPAPLLAVLRKRGVEPTHTTGPHAALAELCLAQRAGLKSALVLSGVEGADRLLSAAERFAPDAVVWIYDPGANPPLRPFVGSQGVHAPTVLPATVNQPVQGDRPPRPSAPELKLARPSSDHADSAPVSGSGVSPAPRPRPVSAMDVLDDAELAMLLAGERGSENRPR